MSLGYFPAVLLSVRTALPSLGFHSLLPYALKHFGLASIDPCHPSYSRPLFNYEREWAWSLCSACMGEVDAHGRAFLQSPETISFLERVTPDLRDVALHPLKRGSPHERWTFRAVVELMTRTAEVSERNYRYWPECPTGDQSAYFSYDLPSTASSPARRPVQPRSSCRASSAV